MRAEAGAGRLVLVARIGKPHGVRGLVSLNLFAEDPATLTRHGPLQDAAGSRTFVLKPRRQARGWVASIDGVTDREGAAALNGTELYLPRAALPQVEADEFYHADLIGLTAHDPVGAALGAIIAVHDFGAGASLEVRHAEGSFLVPFTRACVPEIDLEAGRVTIIRPEEI